VGSLAWAQHVRQKQRLSNLNAAFRYTSQRQTTDPSVSGPDQTAVRNATFTVAFNLLNV